MFRLLLLALFVFTVIASPQVGGSGGNSVCAQWCAANFPTPGNDCTSLAAHGGGPCYDCGPMKTSPSEMLCNGQCANTLSDNKNCGSCGTICPTASPNCCSKSCTNLQTDPNNCNSCGNKCQAPSPYCCGGACSNVQTVNPGVGGSGGGPFTLNPPANTIVKTIKLWTGGWGYPNVLSGLQVVWSDGSTSMGFGNTNFGTLDQFTFQSSETIQSMTISAEFEEINTYVTQVTFVTSEGRTFTSSGSGGDSVSQNVGSGVLVGFAGRSGSAIDQLGATFAC